MAQKTYGYVRGDITGDYYEVHAASERYFIAGGSVVLLNGGKITLALKASTNVFGFALAPQSVAAGSAVTDYYATVAGDKMYVCTSPDVVFSMPADANFAQSMIGTRCRVTNANATTIQTVETANAATTNSMVRIVGGVVGKKIVHVELYRGNYQAAGT